MPEQGTNRRHTRRRFLTTTGVAGTALLAGCTGDDDDGGDTTDDTTTTVQWILNPAQERIEPTVQYAPLFEYLESEADVEVEPTATASYSGTVQELRRAGEGDEVYADVSPGAVAQIPDEIDVTGVRVAFGAEQYFSLITTTTDSGIEELADLEGETIATAAPTSVSGSLFPMLMLSNAGLDIGDAPSGSPNDFEVRASDHSTAREQLVQRDQIAAAGTGAFSTAPHVPQEQFDQMSDEFAEISAEYEGAGEREPQLNLLAVSDPIPRAPIVSNEQWTDPLKDELRELMIDAPDEAFQQSQEEIAEELGVDTSLLDQDEEDLSESELADVQLVEDHELWFSGVQPGDEETYAPISTLADELGLDFANL